MFDVPMESPVLGYQRASSFSMGDPFPRGTVPHWKDPPHPQLHLGGGSADRSSRPGMMRRRCQHHLQNPLMCLLYSSDISITACSRKGVIIPMSPCVSLPVAAPAETSIRHQCRASYLDRKYLDKYSDKPDPLTAGTSSSSTFRNVGSPLTANHRSLSAAVLDAPAASDMVNPTESSSPSSAHRYGFCAPCLSVCQHGLFPMGISFPIPFMTTM